MTPHQLPATGKTHTRLLAWGPFLAVIVLLSILWAVVLVFAVVQEQRMVDGAQKQLRLVNNAVAQQTRDLLRVTDSHHDLLQHWLTHTLADPRQDAALAQLLDAIHRRSEGLRSLALVTQAGAVIPTATTPPWHAAMPAVQLPATPGELQVGNPVRLSADDPWRWPLSRRLPAPVGEVAGIVTWVDLARLGVVHERLREKPAGAVSIVTAAGVLVLRTPASDGLVGRNLSERRPPARAVPASATHGAFEHDGALTGGQRRLATFERLAPYPVTVLASQEREEVLSAFHARRNVGIVVLLVLTLLGATFSWLLARSQRATRHSQAQFDAVSNAFPLGLFMTDTFGETTYANDAYFQKLGLERSQMAWGWSDLLQAGERSQVMAEWRHAASTGSPVKTLVHVVRPDGRAATLSVRTAPLKVDDRLVGLVGSMEDVTDRIQQQRAQRMLTAIFERSTDVVAQVSAQGQMLYLNPAARALLQLKPDDPIDKLSYDDFLPAHREPQVRDVILPTAVATGIWLGETSILCGDGREIDVSEMLIVHRDEQQEIETYSVVMRDITRELRARAQLQRSESVLNIVAAKLPVLVAVADRNQRYLFTNDAFARWVGRPQGRLVGEHARDVLGEKEYARRLPYIETALGGQRVVFESSGDGGQHFESTYIPFRDADGQVAGLVVLAQDITSHKRQQQILLDASQTDVLTGTLNRAGFDLRVAEVLARASDDQQMLALLYVDLDRFKPVNDEHGHATGDALLVAVAKRLQKALRPTDLLARLGGDEFAVVLPDVKDDAAARTVARKIVATLGEVFDIDGKRLAIGASVGLALARNGEDTVQSLSHRADVALYQAKRAGRGRFEVASSEG